MKFYVAAQAATMKPTSELKKIFEDLAPENTLNIGLIIKSFSFTISSQLEDFLQV
jgi:hypothetical protein